MSPASGMTLGRLLRVHERSRSRPALFQRAVVVLGVKYGMDEQAAADALIRCALAWRMSVREAAARIVDRAEQHPEPSASVVRNDTA
jgi:AmiR/NasT family two-component response regulator